MMVDDVKQDSLRERKKARTRSELIRVAERRFRKHGYEETTLEQIADEADVSIRTLLRYFESKQQLALAGHYDLVERFCARMAEPDRPGTLSCWRRHVQSAAEGLESQRSYATHVKFLMGVPTLVMGLLEVNRRHEDAIAEGLAQDAGVDPETDLYGRLLASMLVAGNWAAMRRWLRSGRREDLTQVCLAVVDFAIGNFPARSTSGAQRLAAL